MINLFSPLRTALIYALFGIVWILTTDSLLRWLYDNMPGAFWLGQRAKGLIFVTMSAGVLYWLLQKYLVSLRRSETAYLSIFQTNPNPMWVFGADDYRIVEVNDAAMTTYGYTREEFRNMTILDLRPAEDVQKVLQQKREPAGGFHSAGVWRHLKKDGTLLYVEVQTFSSEYNGEPVVVASIRDITDKHIASQALATQQQLLSTIINSTADLIWAVDTNLHYVAFNDAFRNTIQLLAGVELKPGDPIIRTEGEAEYQKWKGFYERSLQGQKQVIEEVRALQDIGIAYAEITMDPIINQGAIIGVACFAHNITERKEQEIQMKKVLERYDMVTLATSDVIWDWDLATNTVVWNRNLELQFGYTQVSDQAGWWELNVHPDDVEQAVKALNEAVQQHKKSWRGEYRFRRADGEYRHVIDRGYVLYGEDGVPFRLIGAIQDVEEKKRYIEELKNVAQLSSHSLRRPVASMLGIVDLLNKDNLCHPDNAPLMEMVEKVAKEMDGILHVVADKCNKIFRQTEKV